MENRGKESEGKKRGKRNEAKKCVRAAREA